jgi:hypothetical protein
MTQISQEKNIGLTILRRSLTTSMANMFRLIENCKKSCLTSVMKKERTKVVQETAFNTNFKKSNGKNSFFYKDTEK